MEKPGRSSLLCAGFTTFSRIITTEELYTAVCPLKAFRMLMVYASRLMKQTFSIVVIVCTLQTVLSEKPT